MCTCVAHSHTRTCSGHTPANHCTNANGGIATAWGSIHTCSPPSDRNLHTAHALHDALWQEGGVIPRPSHVHSVVCTWLSRSRTRTATQCIQQFDMERITIQRYNKASNLGGRHK
jgi:hypothetical protein